MSGLARLLAASEPFGQRLKVKALEPITLKKVVDRIEGDSRDLDTEKVAAFQARIAAAILAGGAAELSRRDLTEACKVFLHSPRLLAVDPTVADGLISEVAALKRRSALLSLLDAYLDGFSPGDSAVATLAARLKTLAEGWPWRATDLWPDRARAFSILDPTKAPGLIAAAVLASTRPPPDVLAESGLDTDGRRHGGLAETAFEYACAAVAGISGARAVAPQVRLVDWANMDGKPLAYPKEWVAYARGLFEPWRNIEPNDNHKGFILDAALQFGGDPRVAPSSWSRVKNEAPAAYEVLIRWLTRASITQFFDIVSQTMAQPNEQRMWRDRRRFWTAYLDTRAISEAWVAFGADGARRAADAARHSKDTQLLQFGRIQSGAGKTPQHAALIMKIGDTTIVDWSHNGRWNVWGPDEMSRPPLGQRVYRVIDLANPREDRYGAHQGQWQSRLAKLIYELTGCRP